MVDFGLEVDDWRLEWVLGRQVDVNFEVSALVMISLASRRAYIV